MNKSVTQFFMAPGELLESLPLEGVIRTHSTTIPMVEKNNTKVIAQVIAAVVIGYLAIQVYESFSEKDKEIWGSK